ncbi:MAG: WecB/TagA/CpsF family glycosyltransferase [Caldilineaceae bacterium]
MRKSVNILGVRVDCVDFAATLQQIQQWIEGNSSLQGGNELTNSAPCRQICTVNPEFVIDSLRDPAFAAILAQADLCVPDGIGILWAARSKGVILAERVTGSDGIYRICEAAAQHHWSVYFLGAAPGVAEQTAKLLQSRYPGLCVCGWYSGSPSVEEWISIRIKLQAHAPDILFVAYGHPRQDFWIAEHRHELPAKVAIGVGGAFDFVTGVQQRAPHSWQRLGLEWAYRLLHDPRRWRRMLKLPRFAILVLGERVRNRTG